MIIIKKLYGFILKVDNNQKLVYVFLR